MKEKYFLIDLDGGDINEHDTVISALNAIDNCLESGTITEKMITEGRMVLVKGFRQELVLEKIVRILS